MLKIKLGLKSTDTVNEVHSSRIKESTRFQ